MSALSSYNSIIAKYAESDEPTTRRRIMALSLFKRRFPKQVDDLLSEFKSLWPHWCCLSSFPVRKDKIVQIGFLINRLEVAGLPTPLDTYFPSIKRGRSVVKECERTVRRFLSSEPNKPQIKRIKKPVGNCTVHKNVKAFQDGLCPSCRSRITLLTNRGIIGPSTPKQAIAEILSMKVTIGRYSNMTEKAIAVVRAHQAEGHARHR